MNPNEKLKLGKKLINFKIPEKDNIYFPKDNTVGIEIEFKNAKFHQVSDELFEKKSPFTVCTESTVHEKDPLKGSFSRGGEINSPIITSNLDYYKNLKEVCNIIKFCNGNIDKDTACHIHIGSQAFKSEESINNLLFIWANFEEIINRFLNGDNIINDHNSKFSKKCKEEFKKANYNFENLKRNKETSKLHSISFYYFKSFSYEKENTIEFRNIRSTFDENIILNNVEFLFRLIDFLNSSSNAELRKLESYINKFSLNPEINFEKACFLSNLIYSNKLERYCFLKQYFKDFYLEGDKKRIKLTK